MWWNKYKKCNGRLEQCSSDVDEAASKYASSARIANVANNCADVWLRNGERVRSLAIAHLKRTMTKRNLLIFVVMAAGTICYVLGPISLAQDPIRVESDVFFILWSAKVSAVTQDGAFLVE